MAAWTSDELTTIGAADELQIITTRHDGTRRKPVTIWVVRYGDNLYSRSYKGSSATWLRGARAHPEGHIQAGNVYKDVTFVEETNSDINDQIDAIYHSKYLRYGAGFVKAMIAAEVRATTIKLVPRLMP
mgnify:CR=1 FL=1